jgi:wobble nucleotide-excising tRNase
MITNIGLDCINSFKNLSALNTDKKINLIYGLNGTGKSTLTNFLYSKDDEEYHSCTIDGLLDEILLVYNRCFIQDTFYEPDRLNGIFTLSKENKEAEEKINVANNRVDKFEDKKAIEMENKDKIIAKKKLNKEKAENKVWKVKKDYTGGDRILEFCLEGYKNSKDKLFNFISSLPKPDLKPEQTSDHLKKETEALKGDAAKKYNLVPSLDFTGHIIESDSLLQKEIIGNENSTVAGLIQYFNNSDWVKMGLEYLPEVVDKKGSPCPFCQQNTITETVVSDIKNFFDETYEYDIRQLNTLKADYQQAITTLSSKETYVNHPFVQEKKSDFELLFDKVLKTLNDNLRKIDEKQKAPSKKAILIDSSEEIERFNNHIADINLKIEEHNQKIENKEAALENIKETFWNIMRWDYDQTLTDYLDENVSIQSDINNINAAIDSIDKDIKTQKDIIRDQQRNTVNIEEAIININNGLIDLGIDDFHIKKYSNVLYEIVRDEDTNAPFQSLSEGEKMVISFLYFIELCKGKKDAITVDSKKIVVIDDPISSLSHIYIFNVGRMIKNHFFKPNNYEQVFVLTHSLYFFYELTERNQKQREKK